MGSAESHLGMLQGYLIAKEAPKQIMDSLTAVADIMRAVRKVDAAPVQVAVKEPPASKSKLRVDRVVRAWTKEEEQRLLDLHRAGRTLRAISDELGREYGPTYAKLKSLEAKQQGK